MKKKKTYFMAWLLCLLLAAGVNTPSVFAEGYSDSEEDIYGYYDEEDEEGCEEEEDEEDDFEDGEEGEVVDDEEDEVESFFVYFNENGGEITSDFNEVEAVCGEPYGRLPKAKRSGFSFAGWYTKEKGGTKITEDTVCTLTDDVTLHAHWKSTGGYTITYELDGGINHESNPDEYKKSSKTIKLKNPKKNDFTFAGWYTDKKYKNQITKIKKGSKGNLKIYAKWLNNPSFSKVSTNKNKVTLKWKKCSGAIKYKVYQATSADGTYKACATVKTNSAVIKNLKYGKTYYYKVAAVYEVLGKVTTTEKSPVVSACCTKKSTSAIKNPVSSNTNAPNVSSGMVFYYNLSNWDFPYNERVQSCFCCSPAMVLHAMGYNCDPNKLYKVLGGVLYNASKIEKKYGVKITNYNLTGKTEAAREKEIYSYLASRPQGVMVRCRSLPHTQVAYLKDGVIKFNDPGLKNGECIDIGKSMIKSYKNIDYVITVDK